MLGGILPALAVGVLGVAQSDFTPPASALQVVELMNHERVKHGLPPVKASTELMRAAQVHAKSLSTDQFFDHSDQQGKSAGDRAKDAGYRWTLIAENIAAGQDSPAEVMNTWMNSPKHRANILNARVMEVGVGYITDRERRYDHYWVMDLACRADVFPVVINLEATKTKQREVRLSLHGKELFTHYRLSADGHSWGEWLPFQSEVVWTLPGGKGRKTVWVELRDGGGNVLRASDDIELIG
ncbi:MAG: hypothetical protein HONBIEJF_02812 [Fimbriimonadaceae bacterium]|nr:hypothetical protein [Fimbriimonadaceae bacterium]